MSGNCLNGIKSTFSRANSPLCIPLRLKSTSLVISFLWLDKIITIITIAIMKSNHRIPASKPIIFKADFNIKIQI